MRLEDEREDSLAVAGVVFAKLLDVTALLLLRPSCHRRDSDRSEEGGCRVEAAISIVFRSPRECATAPACSQTIVPTYQRSPW